MALFSFGAEGAARRNEIKARVNSELRPLYAKLKAQQAALESKIGALKEKYGTLADLVASRTTDHSQENGRKFQYLWVNTADPNFSPSYLDVLGQQAWELVAADSFSVGGTNLVGQTNMVVHTQLIFKREIISLPEHDLAELVKEHSEATAEIEKASNELQRLAEYETILKNKATDIDPSALAVLTTESD